MNVSAVILREMRAEARRPLTYGLRVAAGGLLLLVATVGMKNNVGSGAIIFGGLHSLLFVSIWVIVPLLTADCISRERREGTLGLLFLTPLSAPGIILAKGFVQGLRGGSYLLTALPAVTIPFLLGGISGRDLGQAALLDSSAVLLALASGLLASAFSVRWSRALVAAELLSFCIATSLPAWHCWLMQNHVDRLEIQWNLITDFDGIWSKGLPSALIAALQVFIASVFLFGLVVLLAGYRLRRSWQEEPLSRRQTRLIQIFCTPLFWQKTFEREQTRKLNRNPIAWLQQYSWSARLCTWGWCLGMLLYECMLATAMNWRGGIGWQILPLFFMVIALAFTAAGSFARERQNGAMELLLVSPLTVGQIIYGRLLGVVGQFIPATGIWLLCNFFLNGLQEMLKQAWWELGFASTGLACAFIGFYFSIRRLNFIAAWGLALVFAVFLPVFISAGLLFLCAVFVTIDLRTSFLEPQSLFSISLISTQILCSWRAITKLGNDLTRRNFSFS